MRQRLLFLCFLIPFYGFSASQEDQDSLNSLILGVLSNIDSNPEPADTVSDFVVIYEPYVGSNRNKMPTDILGIVRLYSAPEKDYSSNIEKVLGFMENAYSEHDYHESGSWVKNPPDFRFYVPYPGELPSYSTRDFRLPTSGGLTSGYGYRENRHRYHYGIDIHLNIGDTVTAVLPGIVTKIGYERDGYGNYVVVTHSGDVETIYAHLLNTIVAPGQILSAGSPIGLGGTTGNSTGPHLHFETRFRGVPVNPLRWFNFPKLEPSPSN